MRAIKGFTLALFVIGTSAQAVAFNPQPDPPGFGMVGVVRGQTARLNVVIDNPNIRPGGDRSGPTPHMRLQLQFVDGSGNVLRQSEVRLQPGHAAHLDYVAPDVGDRGTSLDVIARQQIRAMIIDGGVDDPNIKDAGRILATLEVFGTATGQTAFVLPGTESCFKEVDPAPAH